MVGPAILVGLGLVLLLNNLGWLSWEIWPALLRFWPVILIAIGLDLVIGRRSAVGSSIIALATLALLGAAIWWSDVWLGAGTPPTSQAIQQPLNGAQRAEIDIGQGAGTLRLGAQSEPNGLISGTVAQGPRDQVQREYAVSSGVGTFKLHAVRQGGWGVPTSGDALVWDLRANPEIPLRLNLSTGAGTASLDLAQLNVTDLSVSTGVGSTTLKLPLHGVLTARVSGGVGETTITLPAGVAARISASTGLGQVRVQGNFQREGKLYISPNYASAADRVDLEISGGIGSVTVVQELGR
jgi:hypothetical protein